MLSRLDLRGANPDLNPLKARGEAVDASAVEGVRAIIAEVRGRGDDALRDLTEQFDGCTIDDLRVPGDELLAALQDAPADVRAALEYAREEVTAYHEAQLGGDVRVERNGVLLRELVVPVDRAGLYVPGGRATYPSTVLMTAIPARVAGVPEIALCVPPDPDGRVPAVTLAAAALAGVDEVYRVGGAQAIAALAYGTETIRPVDVIVGPGNMYVTAAKREVAGIVGIESLAGPSELVVVADDTADPAMVAADLVAQAEHGPDGAAILVTWDEVVADTVNAGFYIMDPAVLRYVPNGEAYSFERGLFPLLLQLKEQFFGFELHGYWLDIGSPQRYAQAHNDNAGKDDSYTNNAAHCLLRKSKAYRTERRRDRTLSASGASGASFRNVWKLSTILSGRFSPL